MKKGKTKKAMNLKTKTINPHDKPKISKNKKSEKSNLSKKK
jgi:hypothetical protein